MSKAESVIASTTTIIDQNKLVVKKLDILVKLLEKQDEKIQSLTQELNETKKEMANIKEEVVGTNKAIAQRMELKNKTIINMDKVVREVKKHNYTLLELHDLNKETDPFISYMDNNKILHIWASGLISEKK
jgi:CHAT domain-containing protein